ncbi:MAG: ABC transporter permease, partial [Promicromonosporaceae bacterium]|nr:ABC transporter permease [Promicromonosporaceae bacterium]
MSAVTVEPMAEPQIIEHRVIERRAFKLPIILTTVVALLLLLLGLGPRSGDAVFRLSVPTDYVYISDLHVNGMVLAWVCTAVAALLLPVAWLLAFNYRKLWTWATALFVLFALVAFLAWA